MKRVKPFDPESNFERCKFRLWIVMVIALSTLVGGPLFAQQKQAKDDRSPGQRVGAWKPVTANDQPELEGLVGGAYTEQGPGPITFGQVENITDRQVTGAVECLAIQPGSSDVIFVGGVNGGIFKTTNATAASPTWTAQFDSETSLSISAIEFDTTDGTNNTLCAGIGARSSMGGIGGSATGVYRTTNGGTTWTALPGMADRQISGLAPRGSTIVASVNTASPSGDRGVWQSTNTGMTWTQTLIGQVFDLASDPNNAAHLFASVTTGASPGIYRSTNTGATWTKVSSPAMDALLGGSTSSVEIAVGQAGAAGITMANVFVAIVGGSGSLTGVFRSPDSGTTWAGLDLPGTTETTGPGAPSFISAHPGGQGSIHLSLAADPTDSNICYIGGDRQPRGVGDVGSFPNASGASDFTARIFRIDASAMSGSQTAPITHCGNMPLPSACNSSFTTASNSAPHADSRAMAFDSNGDLIETDDGGIYKHTNPNGTGGDWFSLNGDLAVNEQHDTAYDPVSNIVIAGNQDTGSIFQLASGGTTWSSVLTADGGDVAVGANDPMAMQSTRYMSFQFLGSALRQVWTSTNMFVSTTFLTFTPLGGDPAMTAQFYTPIKVNGVTPSRIVFGGGNGVYESFDRGGSISRLSTDTVNSFGRNAMAYGASGNADVLYYGAGSTVFVRTAAPPAAPAAATALPAGGSTIRSISIDPDSPLTAVVVDSDQVFMTTNGGTTWSDITGNLQTFSPSTVRSVAYLNGTPGMDGIAVGTNRGVYVSLEISGFTVWDQLGTGLPNAPVFDLDFSNGDDTLVVGTLGRGAFSLSPIINQLPVELISFEVE